MKLRLHITKNTNIKNHKKSTYIRFAVTDPSISKNYPANYICILPKQIKPETKAQNKFTKKYGNKSLELAKQLLKKALRTEEDQEIRREIRRRLKLLTLQPAAKVKCPNCGKLFRQKKKGTKKYRVCYKCHLKRCAIT